MAPSFEDRWQNSLPDYVTATPVEGDPFKRAAQRVRAPYEKANQRESGLLDVLNVIGGRIKSGLTAPRDALTGDLQVNDPETNMPTQETMGRAGEVAGLTGIGSPFAVKGALGSAGGKLMQMEKPDRIISADSIQAPHSANDFNKLKSITTSMEKNGWKGRPILAIDSGNELEAITGSHRIRAAKQLGVDVPIVHVSPKALKFEDSKGFTFRDAQQQGDEELSSFLRKAGDTRAANLMDKEVESNNNQSTEKAPPFYSALEHAVENTKQQKMPADQWLGTISNSKGVKPEEMDWTGFKDFLAEKGKEPVTKTEVQEHLNNNKVELNEVNKGKYDENTVMDQIAEEHYGRSIDQLSNDEIDNVSRLSDNALKQQTKYSQYQLPGGENYREMLMTMPNKPKPNAEFAKDYYENFVRKGGQPTWEELPAARQQQLIENNPKGLNTGDQYKSSHWDEPNILAHVRMNDRNIEGKRSLHLEEIQSDWHQQGREHGYRQTIKNPKNEVEEMLNRENQNLPPDAPFKKSWHELALKRMVREAAEKGYDRLSWTPGEANRTNPKNLGQTGESAERADRGLKKFYDEIIPQSLEKIGKEHGVKVKTAEISTKYGVYDRGNNLIHEANNKTEAEKYNELHPVLGGGRTIKSITQPVHYIDIPESLKNVATQKGFPLFSSGLPITFTPVEGDPHKSANTVGDAIDTAANKYGINPTVLKGIASIESSWDPGSNRNKATQYKGLFQIGKEEWKKYGSGDIYNAKDNANAAAKMLADHAQWFKDNYGHDPTPGEFYMMHQQGRGFISNGTMTNVGGNPYPGMRGPQTPETFKQGWSDTLARKMAQFGGADSISDGTERTPSSKIASNDTNFKPSAHNSPHKFTPVDFNPFDLVNHANYVPYGAGASDTPSGYPVNIDKRIPQHNDELKLPDGEPADLHKYLTIHEIEEYKAMKNGVPYHTAHHDIATPMEKKAVESDGVDWKKYEHVMDGYLKKTEEEGYKNLPKGLYAKPYHSRSLIKPEPKKDNEK